MRYTAYITREGTRLLAEFPDCPGCQTFTEAGGDIVETAREALEGWLEAHLVDGQVPPRPSVHYGVPQTMTLVRVPVRPGLAAALHLRWARHDSGLSQRALGELAGVSQQQIAKLEDPDENPSLETLAKVGKALGVHVHIELEPIEETPIPRRNLRSAARANESPPARGSTAINNSRPRSWTPDEILLTFKLYVDIRDEHVDDVAGVEALASLLSREPSAVRAAVFAPAKDDPLWSGKRPLHGLSEAARRLWLEYNRDIAQLRRIAKQIEQQLRHATPR